MSQSNIDCDRVRRSHSPGKVLVYVVLYPLGGICDDLIQPENRTYLLPHALWLLVTAIAYRVSVYLTLLLIPSRRTGLGYEVYVLGVLSLILGAIAGGTLHHLESAELARGNVSRYHRERPIQLQAVSASLTTVLGGAYVIAKEGSDATKEFQEVFDMLYIEKKYVASPENEVDPSEVLLTAGASRGK